MVPGVCEHNFLQTNSTTQVAKQRTEGRNGVIKRVPCMWGRSQEYAATKQEYYMAMESMKSRFKAKLCPLSIGELS